MKMETATLSMVASLIFVIAQLHLGLAFSSTVPAFLWSHNLDGLKEEVDYRVLSPRNLAKSVMIEGGWSKYLCPREDAQQSRIFAFLFIGKELHSADITKSSNSDPALVDLLKDSFSNSNTSRAFPYLASSTDEKGPIESFLISEIADNCQQSLGISSVALVGSCSVQGEYHRLKDINSVNEYLNSRIGNVPEGPGDLIVVCPGDSLDDSNQSISESSILSELLNSVNQLARKYTVLYVTDPFRSTQSISHRTLERFLAEGIIGNGSFNSTLCDSVCQIKSSLLEGLLVGLVLLIILISGLCCMMGIDTPTRFEAPQES